MQVCNLIKIVHYENGTGKPHFNSIRKICELLDPTYDDVFNE